MINSRVAIEDIDSLSPFGGGYRAVEVSLPESATPERWLQVDIGWGEFLPALPPGEVYHVEGQEVVHIINPNWIEAIIALLENPKE